MPTFSAKRNINNRTPLQALLQSKAALRYYEVGH